MFTRAEARRRERFCSGAAIMGGTDCPPPDDPTPNFLAAAAVGRNAISAGALFMYGHSPSTG
ncbi:hypothetical protein OG241_07475 [Streptomyces sp. NBC_01390]|uniref:hypothetical protein n=1 Tax=Streptomyces sp. NBC_01390 TaxID=2903850 RepID=UPI00324BBC10